jgi:hypothetical protein
MIDETSRRSRLRTMNSAANRPKIGRDQVHRDATAQARHQVQHEETDRPEYGLQHAPQHPQRPHVHEQVQQSQVEEHGGDEAVVLTSGDAARSKQDLSGDRVLVPQGTERGALLQQRSAAPAEQPDDAATAATDQAMPAGRQRGRDHHEHVDRD